MDNEEEEKEPEEIEVTNKYMVDMIAEYKDQNEDLVLHWGIGKN